MKISTWNVNSINARINHLEKLILEDQSDIYLLQELKTVEEGFPKDIINKLGYFSYVYCYNSNSFSRAIWSSHVSIFRLVVEKATI